MVKMNSVRVLLFLAANLDWLLHQFDVKNAFLHSDLEEKVYMDISLGFEDHQTEGKLLALKDVIFISQKKYVLDLLKETRMLGCKARDPLLEPNQKLGDDEGGAAVDRESYQ
ncbi:uncharacterized protein LOC114271728 [Camellia sinensis]|uniref:uncharacterized protein LOC114271728 n=1 Tax=Camellia sinensis TaxID=4442 RepID=UPI001035D7A8|nr:uncharacterized protein LOC114271728 [Camellia sinensis]